MIPRILCVLLTGLFLACGGMGTPVKHDMPVKTYKATMPAEPKTFTFDCELASHYNYRYSYAKETHLSVSFFDPESRDTLYGFVARDSDLGKQILEALKDGKSHRALVTVRYGAKESSGITEIDGFRLLAR